MLRRVFLVAVVCLLATANSQFSTIGSLSCLVGNGRCTDVQVQAGNNTVAFLDGAALQFMSDQKGQVTLGNFFTNGYSLPTQALGPVTFGSGSLGGASSTINQLTTAYGVFVPAGMNITNVQLTTPPVSSSSAGLISQSNPLSALQFSWVNDILNSVRLPGSTVNYDQNSRTASVALPNGAAATGIYVFPALANIINAGQSGNVRLSGHAREWINWDTGVNLNYDSTQTQTITAQVLPTSTVQANQYLANPTDGSKPLDTYIKFDLGNFNQSHTSTLVYNWDTSRLPIANLTTDQQNRIRFGVYVPSSLPGGCDCWRYPYGQYLNASAGQISVPNFAGQFFPQWWGLFQNPSVPAVQDGNPCASNPCTNGATCAPNALYSLDNSLPTFQCVCPAGFTGQTCQDTDFCAQNPCKNGGTCNSNGVASGYVCACSASFTGTNCENSA